MTAAVTIHSKMFTNSNHRINFRVWEDEAKRIPQDVTGDTIVLRFNDAGGATVEYAATLIVPSTSEASGQGFFTLTGASHTDPGAWQGQVQINTVPKESFDGTLLARL